MRILILNWKDVKHPDAGGAEIITHQFAKYLVKFGHQVTQFSTLPPGLKPEEILEGVRIIRRGNIYTVYVYAFIYYVSRLRRDVDVVIDQIHGIPFFTPLYIKKPILAYIHEVAGTIWFKEFNFLAATIGLFIESFYFRFYKHVQFLTDTASTKDELLNYEIISKQIQVLPLTTVLPSPQKISKTKYITLIYVGRVSPMKRVDFLIYAAALLRHTVPQLKVVIAGNGKPDYIQKLKRLISDVGLEKHVRFMGFVTEGQKYRLLSSAWLLIHPSIKEGFGLTVLEAASQGTPIICFNVPGLKDLVQHEKTGIIVSEQTALALSQTVSNLLSSPDKLKKLSQNAYRWSKTLPAWEEQTRKLERLLVKIYVKAA